MDTDTQKYIDTIIFQVYNIYLPIINVIAQKPYYFSKYDTAISELIGLLEHSIEQLEQLVDYTKSRDIIQDCNYAIKYLKKHRILDTRDVDPIFTLPGQRTPTLKAISRDPLGALADKDNDIKQILSQDPERIAMATGSPKKPLSGARSSSANTRGSQGISARWANDVPPTQSSQPSAHQGPTPMPYSPSPLHSFAQMSLQPSAPAHSRHSVQSQLNQEQLSQFSSTTYIRWVEGHGWQTIIAQAPEDLQIVSAYYKVLNNEFAKGKSAAGTAVTFSISETKMKMMRIGEGIYMLGNRKYFPVIVPETLKIYIEIQSQKQWAPAKQQQVEAFKNFCYPNMSDDNLSINPSTIAYPPVHKTYPAGGGTVSFLLKNNLIYMVRNGEMNTAKKFVPFANGAFMQTFAYEVNPTSSGGSRHRRSHRKSSKSHKRSKSATKHNRHRKHSKSSRK